MNLMRLIKNAITRLQEEEEEEEEKGNKKQYEE